MKLNYCELLANTIYDKLGEISEGHFTGLNVYSPVVEEGYITPTTKHVDIIDRNGVKYKITIEEIT